MYAVAVEPLTHLRMLTATATVRRRPPESGKLETACDLLLNTRLATGKLDSESCVYLLCLAHTT